MSNTEKFTHFLFIMVTGTVANTIVLMFLWEWFISPVFMVPYINPGQFAGIWFTIRFLLGWRLKTDKEDKKP